MLVVLVGAQGDSIVGYVRAHGSADPVADARVRAVGTTQVAFTDNTGRYALPLVGAGRHLLNVERLGFNPVTVAVFMPEGGSMWLDIDLEPIPVVLKELRVTDAWPHVTAAPHSDAPGHARWSRADAERDPLAGSPNPFAALVADPAVSGHPESATSLRVRGGSGTESLVLVDGLPWRGAPHLGGLVAPTPDGTVDEVELYGAVPPPRYGGALSGVVELRTRAAPSHAAFDGRIDASVAEVAVAGPLPIGGMRYLIAARHDHHPAFGAANETEAAGTGRGDGFLRLGVPTAAGHLDGYFLTSHDRLAFPSVATGPGPTGQANDNTDEPPVPLNRFRWAGMLVGAVWREQLTAARQLTARAWYSRVGTDAAWRSASVTDRLRDAGASVEIEVRRPNQVSGFGVSVSRTATRYQVLDGTARVVLDAAPVVAAAFGDLQRSLTVRWTVSAGLRAEAEGGSGISLQPRVWTGLAVGRNGALSLGYARMSQLVQSAGNEEHLLDAVARTDFPIRVPGATGRSDAVTARFVQRLGEQSRLEIGGFARWFRAVPLVATLTTMPFADRPPALGRGRALGLDAAYRHDGERLGLTAQIGLQDASRGDDGVGYRSASPRLRAALGARYRVPPLGTIRIAIWTGADAATSPLDRDVDWEPYVPLRGGGELGGSPEPAMGSPNGRALPTYARADLGFTRSWRLGPGGRAGRLTTTVGIANLANRHNVLTYAATPDGPRPLLLQPRSLAVIGRWHAEP